MALGKTWIMSPPQSPSLRAAKHMPPWAEAAHMEGGADLSPAAGIMDHGWKVSATAPQRHGKQARQQRARSATRSPPLLPSQLCVCKHCDHMDFPKHHHVVLAPKLQVLLKS